MKSKQPYLKNVDFYVNLVHPKNNNITDYEYLTIDDIVTFDRYIAEYGYRLEIRVNSTDEISNIEQEIVKELDRDSKTIEDSKEQASKYQQYKYLLKGQLRSVIEQLKRARAKHSALKEEIYELKNEYNKLAPHVLSLRKDLEEAMTELRTIKAEIFKLEGVKLEKQLSRTLENLRKFV